MNSLEQIYGANAGYALELYDRFRANPDSVDPATRALFERLTDESVEEALAKPASAAPQNQ